ncbi:hypothetical protein Q2T40_09980 [Winogradskyella maritima]|uniref:STAS/SEC14 domain-containing protein n=1 Tax=Winogradskyella maritima TaxID=1517766 RepID=A0ABV8AJV3_9FLAO|nr:hypothetical protein [Winogradskyella maritima]
MKKKLLYDFGTVEIHDSFLIVVMNEGLTLTPDFNAILVDVAEEYFYDTPFVYISHRINSYAVDPKIYTESAKIENLKGFAVVSTDFKAKSNVEIERLFFQKPFESFSSLEMAKDWALNIISE